MSRGNLLDVSGCLCSKVTVWKEEQFTVLPGQGIKQREKRIPEWVAKTKPGVWGSWITMTVGLTVRAK